MLLLLNILSGFYPESESIGCAIRRITLDLIHRSDYLGGYLALSPFIFGAG